jgi:hypothetical protein
VSFWSTCTLPAVTVTVAAAYLLTGTRTSRSGSQSTLTTRSPVREHGGTTTIVTIGSPGWTFVLIAAAGRCLRPLPSRQ